jgi:hypothetical protein
MSDAYRDDSEAIRQRLNVLDKESEELRRQNEVMRQEILAMQRSGQTFNAPDVYNEAVDIRFLTPAHRASLSYHQLKPFPIWAIGLLTVFTLGLFPLIHFGLMHDKLPRAAHNDPTSGKAIGFQFIPYFNLYWVFFNSLRLADRLNLQFRLRGMQPEAPRGMMVACSIFTVIPYLNLLFGIPIMWTIGNCLLQSSVNKLASLDPYEPWRTHRALPPATPHQAPGSGETGRAR